MKKKMKIKILVTGASGMLGLRLCKILENKGFKVYKKRFDITSQPEIKNVSEKLKVSGIDYVIHCAAMTEVNKCEQNKALCYEVNAVGTKNIVDLARQFKANLIYISTPMIFSGKKGNYKETDIPHPVNYYAKTKLLGEKEVVKYKQGLVVRVNPIGVRPVRAHPSFLQWFVQAAKQNKSFSLFSDVRINPISTDTFGRILLTIIKNFRPGILHLGSRDIANKADVWKLIVKKFPGFKGQISIVSVDKTEAAKIANRPKEMWLNIEKAITWGVLLPLWQTEVKKVLKDLGIN